MKGISILLIDGNLEGISRKKLKTQGWISSNTALIIFENVKVPAKNLLGKEHLGFIQIMENFNFERYHMSVMVNRSSRILITEAIKYARNRKTFGKRLIDHQTIRHKIAEMARRVESNHSWIEQLTYQMDQKDSKINLAAQLALLKVQCTKDNEFCAREASQILGGNSYLSQGIGSTVERIYRDVRVNAIGGGSEEILYDLAMKQSKL
jgi:acyl-CoA dehydrogenase